MTRLLEALALLGGAPVLPDDRVVDRLTAGPLPDDHGFALIGDSDRCEIRGLHRCAFERAACALELSAPDLLGVVLHPARLRIQLSEFGLRGADRTRLFVEHDRA